jgi:hypothetical protein
VASSTKDPDAVWREVFVLQRAALELPRQAEAEPSAAEASGSTQPPAPAPPTADIADRKAALRAAPALLGALQRVELPSIHWGALLFGFADVRTLQLLEALPRAADAAHYTFAEVRCMASLLDSGLGSIAFLHTAFVLLVLMFVLVMLVLMFLQDETAMCPAHTRSTAATGVGTRPSQLWHESASLRP